MAIHSSVAANGADEIKTVLEEVRKHLEEEGVWDEQNWGTESALLNGLISQNQMQFDDATDMVDRLLNQLTQEKKELKEISPALSQAKTDLTEKIAEIEA